MTEEKKTPSQSRDWLITIQDHEDQILFADFYGLFDNAEWIWTHERGEKTEGLHWHIYVEFKTPHRRQSILNKIHKRFGKGADLRPRGKLSVADRVDYIYKRGRYEGKADTHVDGPWMTDGFVLPEDREKKRKEQGKRTDLEALRVAMLDEGKTMAYVLEDSLLSRVAATHMAYARALRSDYLAGQSKKLRSVNVRYFYGGTGTGKSYDAYRQYPGAFRVSSYRNPFDGYDGQSVIIFEEFNEQIPLDEMLRLLDSYPMRAHARYEDVVPLWTTVVITTNILPWHLYQNENAEQRQALFRRLNRSVEFYGEPTDFDIADADAEGFQIVSVRVRPRRGRAGWITYSPVAVEDTTEDFIVPWDLTTGIVLMDE